MSSVSTTEYDMPDENRMVRLISRPDGIPYATHFEIGASPKPETKPGTVLIRNVYLSADPVQRGWCANPDLMPIGHVMRSLAVGIVVESRIRDYEPGDVVFGIFGWQDYAVVKPENILSRTKNPRADLSLYAGVLGMPGVTAYLALDTLAPPGPDDVVLVSTAAGAVGSIVGQLCGAAGARTVGLTGSDAKVKLCLEHFGYDKALNYKKIDLGKDIENAAPEGYSIYFDNTGGAILDNAVRSMAKYGKIIQCGTAATPAWQPPPSGWRNEREILYRVLTWSGFYIFDHGNRFDEAVDALTDLVLDGTLKYSEDIVKGFANVPATLESLFEGTNMGKKLIDIRSAG